MTVTDDTSLSAAIEDVLLVQDLSVELRTERGPRTVVEALSLTVRPGQSLGIVGESGCGKSISSLAIMGLLPKVARVSSGTIGWRGRDLATLPRSELSRIRGREIAMIFQEPTSCLNPAFTIGEQIAETIRRHRGASRAEAREQVIDLLATVGIRDPAKRHNDYPHQFSGGMAQRAMIAMAISCDPKLLIADEPTTALDVTLQAGILDLLQDLRESRGMGLIMISHDLGVVSRLSDRILVMYDGETVETGQVRPVNEVLMRPRHPYTRALLDARPNVSGEKRRLRAIPSPGSRTDERPAGCRFYPRCWYKIDRCAEHPIPLTPVEGESAVRCIRWQTIQFGAPDSVDPGPFDSSVSRAFSKLDPILTVEGLRKSFPIRSSVLRRVVGHVDAVAGVDFEIFPGETLGLVGESGSGKSTTGRLVLGLIKPTSGVITFSGKDVGRLPRQQRRAILHSLQIVFQDPYSSFDPKMTIRDSLAEPLINIERELDSRDRLDRIRQTVEAVQLPTSFLARYPHELSGGQLQRLAIARALVTQPKLIVCDEAVSALDLSSQASIVNLLHDIQRDHGVALLFISHDIHVVRHISDRVAVMNEGRIVEMGPVDEVMQDPAHDYTKKLLSSVLEVH